MVSESMLDQLLENLIRLEYQAIGACDAAIDGLESRFCQSALRGVKRDHQSHIAELGRRLACASRAPLTHGDMMRLLAKGMAPLAGVIDDKTILETIKLHEDSVDSAYERSLGVDTPPEAHTALGQALQDARRHRDWLTETLKTL